MSAIRQKYFNVQIKKMKQQRNKTTQGFALRQVTSVHRKYFSIVHGMCLRTKNKKKHRAIGKFTFTVIPKTKKETI
jgi:hypothetical protein